MAAALLRYGFAPALVMPLLGVLDFIVLGSAGETFADGFHRDSLAYSPEHPHLTEALEATDRSLIDERAFELALAAWLDILSRHIAHGQAHEPAR
jgi:hypothetical protein